MPLYTAQQLKDILGGGADVGLQPLIDALVEQVTFTSAWNGTNPLRLGTRTIWVDATGDVRIVDGTPSGDSDGVVIGAQS